jgi:site-specific DNA-cytosine methylase
MKLLELFSGTCSVGRVAKQLHWDVTSLDLKNADINCDILEWDYKQIPSGHFDFIWASPPCIEYSIAKTVGVRKIEEANKIVLKTLEIIDYFKPRVWFIENPQTGLLKKQPFMKDLHYVDVDYCKYGMPYRKRRRLWNSLIIWQPRPLCHVKGIVG